MRDIGQLLAEARSYVVAGGQELNWSMTQTNKSNKGKDVLQVDNLSPKTHNGELKLTRKDNAGVKSVSKPIHIEQQAIHP